jgi:hypothetical protein
MAGGVLIAILSFFIKSNSALAITFGAILSVMVIVPVVYSYTEFLKEKNRSNQ